MVGDRRWCQIIDHIAQMLEQLFALTNARKFVIENGIANVNRNGCAAFAVHFMDDQGEPQCFTELTGQLKGDAVLAMKIDGKYDRFGRLNQLGDKKLPFEVNGLPEWPVGRGGYPAGWEDHNGVTGAQCFQCPLFGLNIGLDRFRCFVEINGEHVLGNTRFNAE